MPTFAPLLVREESAKLSTVKEPGALEINIISLKEKQHTFQFQIDDAFFAAYQSDIVQKGKLGVEVLLDKSSSMIQVNLMVTGTIELVCDRSLDVFDYPVEVSKRVIFKFGDQHEELSDEITVIPYGEESLDLGPMVYDFVVLEVPMKKLHPRFAEESPTEHDKLIYTAETAPKPAADEDKGDPRWEALRKLKNNN